jgi:hypothetical protein
MFVTSTFLGEKNLETSKPPLESLDKEYCMSTNCDICFPEIRGIGYMIRDISSLPAYLLGKNPVDPIDMSQVQSLRDALLIMKPFVRELNDLLQSIEPLENAT